MRRRSFLPSLLDRVLCVFLAILFAQAPLFMGQYLTTLSGALSESRLVYQDLEERAEKLNLTIDAYVAAHLESEDPIFHQTGQALDILVQRHTKHSQSYAQLSQASIWARPFIFPAHLDPQICRALHFKPGLPFTEEGAAYGLLGVLAGMGITRLFRRKKLPQVTQ